MYRWKYSVYWIGLYYYRYQYLSLQQSLFGMFGKTRHLASVSVMASTIIFQLNQLFSNSEKYPTSLEKHNVFLLIPSFIVILFVLFGGSVGAVVFLHTQYGWEAVKQVGSLRNKESRNTNWRKITVRSAWMRLNISNSVNSNRLFSIRK